MPPVTQRLPDFLGGVSQQAPHRRKPNELEESLNAYHSPLRGFGKRPPTVNVGQLTSSLSLLSDAKVFTLDYGTGQKYIAAIVDGDIKVWDSAGIAQNVSFPHGRLYLNTPADLPHSVTDDFADTNGTDLANHVTPFGAAWTQTIGPANAVQIQNGVAEEIYLVAQPVKEYRLNFPLPVDDYTVSCKIRNKGAAAGNQIFGLKVRGNNTDLSGYFLRLVMTNTPTLAIQRINAAGAVTATIGSTATMTGETILGAFQTLSVRVTGNFIEALFNGVVKVSGTDTTYPTGRYVSQHHSNGSTFDRVNLADDFSLTWTEALPSDALGVIRTATTGRRTFIVNRNRKIRRDTTVKAPTQTPTALIYVEQADYATTYTVTLDGTTISHTTEQGTDASARRLISTDKITEDLKELLTSTFGSFTFTQYGSMLRVQRTDGADFSISAKDGLGDNGLRVLKEIVQRSADLPLRCIPNFVLEVAGEADSAGDNYWVKFDTNGADDFRGVWKECARPGEGIALDASTMPHELVFSDRKTPELENGGFPSQPVVALGGNITKDYESWSATLNGSDFPNTALPVLKNHGDDIFVNFEDTNGGPIKVGVTFGLDTTKMTKDETLILTLAYNEGPSSTTWHTFKTVLYGPGLYGRQTIEAETGASLGVNYDVRVMVEYAGGATPASPGRLTFVFNQAGVWYYNYTARDLTWPTDTVYPKGTVWTVTVDALTPVTYTQTTDMTGAAIAAAIEPSVEALTGIDSSVVNTATGTAIRISKTAGGLPTVVVSGAFDSDTIFYNPDLDIGYAEDALVGYALKNLSDGSEGVITGNLQNRITVASLTGGVENTFRKGDLCVVVSDTDTFTFRQVDWAEREAGDSITNPWPSFVDNFVRDVFFHRARLGMLSAGNIIMSESAVPDNFFRTVTTELVDTDLIDVAWSGGSSTQFHSAVPWNGEIVCFGDRVQVVPRGEPVLSPKTIRLELLSAFPCDTTLRPEPAGRWVFFGRGMGSETRVQALGISPRTRVAESTNVSPDLTDYLAGSPLFFAADGDLRTLFLVADSNQHNLFHLRYTMDDDQPPAYSWGKWTFTGNILGMVVSEATLYLVMSYSDGVYLETLNLSENY